MLSIGTGRAWLQRKHWILWKRMRRTFALLGTPTREISGKCGSRSDGYGVHCWDVGSLVVAVDGVIPGWLSFVIHWGVCLAVALGC